MMNADTQVEETEESSTAEEQPEQELSVPKHRLDEVSEQNRRLKEELEMNKRAISEILSTRQPAQQPVREEDDELDFEQLGLTKEVARKVKSMQGKELAKAKKEFGGIIGQMANNLEETNFLMEYGKEKKDYIPRIRELRKAHAARNSFLDVETAYKLIRVEELDKPAPAKKQAAALKETSKPKETAKAETKVEKAVTPAGRSIEDWEDELDEQIKSSGGKI